MFNTLPLGYNEIVYHSFRCLFDAGKAPMAGSGIYYELRLHRKRALWE